MPSGEGKKGKGGKRKIGRDKARCERYRMSKRREKAKVKRVLASCGINAAKEYATRYGVMGHLQTLLSRKLRDNA